mmetsp:Transcript_9956/g.18351  ORF Transcript_9956/g.18351 Transcript_9956/m.18351 type:complete len:954 (+) Transcript_9956:87-2948(+)
MAAEVGVQRSWVQIGSCCSGVDFTGVRWWFDESNEQVVLLRGKAYYTLALKPDAEPSPPLHFLHVNQTIDVKLSLCKQFLALQRSETVVTVVNLHLSKEIEVRCKSKRGNSVLERGFLWLNKSACRIEIESEPQTCFCLVTVFGMEISRLPRLEKGETNSKLLGTIKHSVQAFWSLPSQNLVLLGNGTEMRPYQFHGGQLPVKLSKFSLKRKPAQNDMMLAKLYDSVYALETDVESRSVNVYKLGRETSSKVKTLRLVMDGPLQVSVVDNLVCMHSMEFGFTSMYDIAAETDHPIIAPTPMEWASQSLKLTSPPPTPPLRPMPPQQVTVEGPMPIPLRPCENNSVYAACLSERLGSALEGAQLVCVNEMDVAYKSISEVRSMVSARPVQLSFTHSAFKDLESSRDSSSTPLDPLLENPTNRRIVTRDSRYISTWVFLFPHWVMDLEEGFIKRIELNLDPIPNLASQIMQYESSTLIHHELEEPSFLLRSSRRLVAFLLRRGCLPPASSTLDVVYGGQTRDECAYAKAILLLFLRNMLAEDVSQQKMTELWELINHVYLKALRERAASPQAIQGGANSPSPGQSPTSPHVDGIRSPKSPATASSVMSNDNESGGQPHRFTAAVRSRVPHPSFLFKNKEEPPAPPPRIFPVHVNELQQNLSIHTAISPGSGSSGGSLRKAQGTERGDLHKLISDFRSAGRIALKDIRGYTGSAVVLQIDIFTWVFMSLVHEDIDPSECSRLADALCSYLRVLQHYAIPVEKYIHELAAWLLITSGKEYVLQQLLQHHVPTPSRRLARTLLEISETHQPFFQLALDMMYRIGCIGSIVRALLSRDLLLPSLQLLRKHPNFMATEHSPTLVNVDTRTEVKPWSVMIHPPELLECALRLVTTEPTSVVALHSFFVSVDPWIINRDTGGPSPLAREAGDACIANSSLPIEEQMRLREAFGFSDLEKANT